MGLFCGGVGAGTDRGGTAIGGTDSGTEFDDFDWALGPVVGPADDEVAACGVVFVAGEVAGAELELDSGGAPEAVRPSAEGVGVGEVVAVAEDGDAQVLGEGAEEVDDAGFVGGGGDEAAEGEGIAVGGGAGDGTGGAGL